MVGLRYTRHLLNYLAMYPDGTYGLATRIQTVLSSISTTKYTFKLPSNESNNSNPSSMSTPQGFYNLKINKTFHLRY